jgi:hypothetical protein
LVNKPTPAAADSAVAAAVATAAALNAGRTPEKAKEEGAAAAAAAAASSGATVTPSPLGQLVSFIPTETVLLYAAVTVALGEPAVPAGKELCFADFTTSWVWVIILAVLTLLLTIGLSYRKQQEAVTGDLKIKKTKEGETQFKVPMLEVAAAVAAFAVWALALPTTPLRDLCSYDYSAWSPVLLLGGTIVIAGLLHIFRKTVAWEKFLTTEK